MELEQVKDPRNNSGSFAMTGPITLAFLEQAVAMVQDVTGKSEAHISARNMNGTYSDVTPSEYMNNQAQRADEFSISGYGEFFSLRLSYAIWDGKAQMQVSSSAETVEQAEGITQQVCNALALTPIDEPSSEAAKARARSVTREFGGTSNSALAPGVILANFEALGGQHPLLEPAEFLVRFRNQTDYNSSYINLAALQALLDDDARFQSILSIQSAMKVEYGEIYCTLTLPNGYVSLRVWAPEDSGYMEEAKAALENCLGLTPYDRARDRYRSGTLTYQIVKWSPKIFETALKRIVTATQSIGRASGYGASESPAPIFDHLYVTREGMSKEPFRGPVEVLESCKDLKEFFGRLNDGFQTLRAVHVSLEGLGQTRFNVTANLRDNRMEIWGNSELPDVQTLAGPLIDGLKMTLIEGKPGASLPDNKPGVLEEVSKQLGLIGTIAGWGWRGLLTTGVVGAGSLGAVTLFGWSSVQATHPVKNDAIFEGQQTQALYIDWELSKPGIRKVYNWYSKLALNEDVDVIVYRNGELQAELTQIGATDNATLTLPPGSYRIDLDHKKWHVYDASIYVKIAAP